MAKKATNLPIVSVLKLPKGFMSVDVSSGLELADHMLRQRGTPIRLTPHVICPCVDPTHYGGTGQAIPDCPACSGTGIAYVEKEAVDILAVVSGVNAEDTVGNEGRLSHGQIRVVFPSDVVVGEGDRLHLYRTMLQVRHVRKYKSSVRGIKLPFVVHSVRSLVASSSDGSFVVLNQSKDYTLNVDESLLTFSASGFVSDGTVISGVFMMTPYYIVSSLSSAYRGQIISSNGKDAWAKMPQTAIAVRADILFGRFQKDISSRGDAPGSEGS